MVYLAQLGLKKVRENIQIALFWLINMQTDSVQILKIVFTVGNIKINWFSLAKILQNLQMFYISAELKS